MRAHTITTISRRRRSARRRRVLALALGVCALAIPATATAQQSEGGYSGVVDASKRLAGFTAGQLLGEEFRQILELPPDANPLARQR